MNPPAPFLPLNPHRPRPAGGPDPLPPKIQIPSNNLAKHSRFPFYPLSKNPNRLTLSGRAHTPFVCSVTSP
jgi:hypothetical protein